MTGVSVQQMADRVAGLIEDRLHVRGATLAEKLRRGGRFLPRRVRASAAYLAVAAERAMVPKLQLQLDHRKIAVSYDACVGYLEPLGSPARRKAGLLHLLTSVAAAVLVTAALVITVLVWRGFL